jgi:hypothetical protein
MAGEEQGAESTGPQEDSGSEELTPEERRFVEELVRRGEAADPVEGELPEDATHEIVERPAGRPPVVRRRRFTSE